MEEQIENIYPASHARVSKGASVLHSVVSGVMKLEPKPTAVKRMQEYNVKRVVLKDLNKNTQKMQGGCGNNNSVASTPVTCLDQQLPVTTETSECELPVQFTREFVEELIENVQCVGDKTASDVPHHTTEAASHLKFETQESLPGSLPDLLLPEAAFKKHSDTDTDTTEYESAAETDPPDGLSHSSSIVAEDSNVFEESAHGSAPAPETQKEETTLPCGDISILCADLNKLNLNSPVGRDITVLSVKKLECDTDSEHSPAHEVLNIGVVEDPSSSINADEEIHLKASQKATTVVPGLPEASEKDHIPSEKNNLCATSADSSIACNGCVVQPHILIESNREQYLLETDAQSVCINEIIVGVEDTGTEIPSGIEDNHQNPYSLPTVTGNDLACANTKLDIGGCEEIATLETPLNITCLSSKATSISRIQECSKSSDSVPQYANFDAVIYSKELLKPGVGAELESVISEVTGAEECVSDERNTTFQLASCDDTSRDLSKTSETLVFVDGSQDIPTADVDLRSSVPDNSEELSIPLLQGGVNSQQADDKDYKLYENIIEISRLQEKDLEKECCDGGTIKKENYSSEGSDFSNLCSNQEELKDFINETLVTDIPEFGNISSEAEKVAEELFNVSQEIEEEVSNSIVVGLKCDMEDHTYLSMDDRTDPFAPKSALRHSPPPVSRTNSPNSASSRGSSPAKRYSIERSSPKSRSKSGTSTPGKESSLSDSESPKSRSKASNSPGLLTKGNEATTETTHAKPSIEEAEVFGSGAPHGADMNSTTVISVGTEDIAYSQTDVSREHASVNISSGSAEQMLDPRRESLYVKFDPLYSTPSKCDLPLPQVDRISLERQEDVAVQPERKKEEDADVECPGSNQALAYIDKLISLSPTVLKPEKSAEKIKDRTLSHISQSEISVPEKECVKKVSNPEDKISWSNNRSPEVSQEAEMLNELQELRNMVLKQEQSYTEKVKMLEKKIESLEIKLKEKDEKESKLNKKIAEMTEGQEQISIIMEEYERTIAGLVYEKEQEKQRFEHEKENLIKEKDTVSGHLENIEIAFSDVHRKYERSKDIIQGIKNNEETLRASLAEYEATIKQQEQKYDFLKSYATSQLESANQELESLRRSHQAESAKLHAMLKKAEIKASSLEEMLEQKIKENQELTAICDELIGKVGSSE
ncbi:uncharacterized protein LOC126188930 [Schistocerca cancellata]|uniref:uncharacterized protein LOC126188930 n=1 Tax=Schistocerca cancellata TaxID=274614 RepID=UPI002118E834|nr:uncharacterized protein LOC126188930 [Schistocerca cancellata]